MPPLKDIISRFLDPLLNLNLAGFAVGGLWLATEAQWQVVWIGFAALLFSPTVIPLLLMPAGIFSHFMWRYREAQRPVGEKVMFVLTLAYIILFLTFWCTGIFEYVTHSILPRAMGVGVLWGSVSALTPLLWWSSRDRNNILILTLVEVAQVAILVLAAVRLLWGVSSFWPSFAILGAIVTSVAVGQAIYEEKFMNKTEPEPR